jgi:hypothetical protein
MPNQKQKTKKKKKKKKKKLVTGMTIALTNKNV